jgi:chloramphenicol-sensitive protein RarD
MDPGIWYGAAAYASWGLFPIYFTLIGHVAALEVLSHRIIWSFLALALVTVAGRRTKATFHVSLRTFALYGAAATLIGLNWFIYVWAVASGFIVETSLGYFITPFVNVLLGVIVFGERLRRGQWAAVVLAAAGVLFLAVTYGSLPWISLVLAISFGSYGLVKKTVAGSPVQGLTLETGVLFLPAVAYALALERTGTASFLHAGAATDALLVGAGLITIVPLLLFAAAVQRVPLSIVGILQYIAPTMSFLLGVLVYREPFSRAQLVGFGFVWAALAVFTAEGLMVRRVSRMVAVDGGTPEGTR